MAQKLSERLQASPIEYKVHPKTIAELYNIADWRFLRTGTDFHAPVRGKDIHRVAESLRKVVVEDPYTYSAATARLRVDREDLGNGMFALTYAVEIGHEIIGEFQETPPEPKHYDDNIRYL